MGQNFSLRGHQANKLQGRQALGQSQGTAVPPPAIFQTGTTSGTWLVILLGQAHLLSLKLRVSPRILPMPSPPTLSFRLWVAALGFEGCRERRPA